MDNPSDTFFTLAPHWTWLVVFYFFIGGVAGGSSFLAGMLDVFGVPQDRPVARIGHLLAAPLVAVGGLLLIVDLNRPERFWHMMIQSESGGIMFKWWSPISFGAWVVLFYGIVSGILFLAVLAETGKLPGGLNSLRSLRDGVVGRVLSALVALFGLFLAGYTGILLATTNRPLWADTNLLGLLFLLSGISAAAGAMTLLSWRFAHAGTVGWLGRMDLYSSALELLVLIVLAISIGSVVNEVWGNAWGALLLFGVIILGILIPLALHWRPRLLGSMSLPSAAALAIVGSFFLRTVVVMASERV